MSCPVLPLPCSHHQDWCISRQLWWGHRIPAYKIMTVDSMENNLLEKETLEKNSLEKMDSLEKNSRWVVGRSKEEATTRAENMLGMPLNP